jgi:pyruvate/2-oxoglutarate/acetoin dehydrogenase E1 component
MGEDIGEYGGAFGVTRGLLAEFGAERVRCTPISEATIVGAATGAALTGMRPVVEIMFMDFLTLAMDQLANHAAKVRYMYGPQVRVPLVLRTPAGGGRCYGATHSQSLEAWFLHVPGVKVIAPATPADAKALLTAAIRDDNPVLCVEHKLLYATTGPVPDDAQLGAIGRSTLRRPGRDVTLVAYSYYVGVALEAAQQLASEGIDAEVLDLRSLVPMDTDAILASVRKTGRLVCIEEGTLTGGVGAEVAARVAEHAYEYLDAPIRRVAAADVPIPFSPALEPLALPQRDDVVRAVRGILK